jgi:cytochrome c oxidase subunit 2
MRRAALLFVSAAAAQAAACSGPQPIMGPAGPAARDIAHLGWFVLITFGAVTVVMWILIAWIALRRTGSFAEHAPWDAPAAHGWIHWGGIAIPIAILAVIFVYTLIVMGRFPREATHVANLPPPAITIAGHQWWWEVQYQIGDTHEHVVAANEVHIPAGRPVDIALISRDVIHSFWVPQLHGKVDLVPGMVNRIRIQADHPGLYRGECAEYCGPQHAHMILLIKAESQADFDAWLGRERLPAATPADTLAARGEQVFLTGPCITCHTVRGTRAQGLVGPDLTHLASRDGIAANAYPNNTAYLEAWVTHAQSLKPYAQMPNITAFTGDDLRALVTYLRGLK